MHDTLHLVFLSFFFFLSVKLFFINLYRLLLFIHGWHRTRVSRRGACINNFTLLTNLKKNLSVFLYTQRTHLFYSIKFSFIKLGLRMLPGHSPPSPCCALSLSLSLTLVDQTRESPVRLLSFPFVSLTHKAHLILPPKKKTGFGPIRAFARGKKQVEGAQSTGKKKNKPEL